jgi:predicted nucleotidyltransferase
MFQEKLVYRNENRRDEFLRAAEAISKKISTIEGVVGILATGGIARGYCDDYSDLDLIVYTNEEKVVEIGSDIAVGWLMYKDIGLDTPVESYEKALQADSPSDYWSQVMRWDRQNAILLFDAENRIRDLLSAKIVFPEWERQQLLKEYADKVEETLVQSFDMWEQRGALVNLADLLITSTKYLIQWIYARNGKFQPYLPKWLFYYLENGQVPEAEFFDVLQKSFVGPITTTEEARQIRDELLDLCGKIGLSFKFGTITEVFQHCSNNWEQASAETKRYLSW